jgi:hypothetical protein
MDNVQVWLRSHWPADPRRPMNGTAVFLKGEEDEIHQTENQRRL